MAAELRKRGAAFPSPLSPKNDNIRESTSLNSTSSSTKTKRYIAFVISAFYFILFGFVWSAHRRLPVAKTKSESSLNEFSEERARQHLDIITSFGSRPTGSYACEVQAVKYILAELQNIKALTRKELVLEIDVQRPTGSFNLAFLDSLTSHYRNITNIVTRIGPRKTFPPQHTVLVNAHFDSVPGSPGASDDAVSCATMLEVLRCLAQSPEVRLTHGIIFQFNGAEENILQASHGFITQHKWADTVRAFVNLEAAGAGGREIVFQAGPEHPWLIKTYTELAKYPFAQAMAQEVFQSGLIPSDTDFRIYRDFGNIPGIDIAYMSNGYVYHTNYDTPAAVTPGSVQRAGENLLAMLDGMANSPFLIHPGDYKHGEVVFFDILGFFMVHYPERVGVVINSVVIVLSVICILSNVESIRKQKKSGKGKESTQSSKLSASSIPLTVMVLLLSWVSAFLPPVFVSLLVTHAGWSLSWYCRPYLAVMLYGIPALVGLALVHCLLRWFYTSKLDPSESKATDEIFAKKETEVFYSVLLMWTILLSIMTYYHLMSAYIPMMCVASPLLVRVIVWERILQRNNSKQEISMKFVTVYLASVTMPVVFMYYLVICNLEVFLPIMGRSGSETIPDIFIACFFAASVVLLTSHLVSLVYVVEDIKVPAAILGIAFVGSLAVTLSGLSFPYSAVHQCPKRVFFQHISRTFHDTHGRVVKQDSGVWINPLDYLGLEPIKHVPALERAKQPPADGVYGGFPYYVPIRHLANQSWYVPGVAPEVSSPLDVKLASREQHQNTYRYVFTISGPDHMTVYISPAAGVEVSTSSIGYLMPIHDVHNRYDRPCYFVFYSHGTSSEPWNFWVEVQADKPMKKGSDIIEIAVAAHYIHDKDSTSPLLEEIARQLPDWVFTNSWVNIYKSWAFIA